MSADVNYESYVAESGLTIENRVFPTDAVSPESYSDILKFSGCKDVTVNNCTIHGGKEDCLDAVRGSNYTIKDCKLHATQNGITFKGAIEGGLIEHVTFVTSGKNSDIELGQFDNYWYIGRPATRNISIRNVTSESGKPIQVVLWDAENISVQDTNAKIKKVPKFIWWPYFVFRAIQVRGIGNLFKPVPADSFIKTG